MKSKVLLAGLLVAINLPLLVAVTPVDTVSTTKEEQLLQKVALEVATPIPSNTPIEVEQKLLVEEEVKEVPVVEPRVIVDRTVTVSRGGEPRRFKLTEDGLENLSVLNMRATAYTLSVASCGKSRSHPQYGITFSGKRATVNRTVAVDPKTIPINSVLYIDFSEPYDYRDGLYVAEDTGSAVKKDIIDIFIGEDNPGEHVIEDMADEFGIRKVKVYIVERGK